MKESKVERRWWLLTPRSPMSEQYKGTQSTCKRDLLRETIHIVTFISLSRYCFYFYQNVFLAVY